ncbi:MAG: 50S ribosomal protein L24 [Clostridia bacterium]|nr:50S ribosomal protein L24 [Clostridia bacterium]
MANIKTGDTVVVLSGNSKGVQGKVIAVSPKENKVLVEGANIIHKHVKARRQGETGGIVDAEGAMYADKVALYCPKCNKGVRVHHTVENGKKIRVCKCGHKFD